MATPVGNTSFNNDTLTGTVGADGYVLPSAQSPTVYHSGDVPAVSTTQGTDTTPVVTETYVAQINLNYGATLTGLALLNGSAVAGNITLALADSTGAVVASTASTAQAGTAAYQQVAFTAPYVAKSGKYFVLAQFNSTSARFRSHVLGNFQAGKLTGQTYGTLPSFTPPAGFTASLGPVIDTY